MIQNIFLPSFKKLKFVDLNKKMYKKPYYKALKNVKKYRDIYQDYQMELEEYKEDKPIRYY